MDYQNAHIATFYDLLNPPGDDTAFYLSLVPPEPCSVLDLGCGTGTLCCALAARGHEVTGVDPSPAMLAVAKSKPLAEQVGWSESSAQRYKSQRRFDFVFMTGHAFQTLLTDADALAVFETMHAHLNRGGTVAFETRNPLIDWAAEWEGRSRFVVLASGGELFETLHVTGKEGEFIFFETSYRTPFISLSTSSTLRFPSSEHIEVLMADSSLAIEQICGDWNSGSFEPACSREVIFIARKLA